MGTELDQDRAIADYAAGRPVEEIERESGITRDHIERMLGVEPAKEKSPKWPLLLAAVGVLLLAGGAVAVVLSSAAGGEPATPVVAAKTAVSGSLELTLPHFTWSSSSGTCWGDGGFSDIRAGASVVVTDEAGVVVAMSTLQPGLPTVVDDRASACTFGITVADVPAGHRFYGVEVSHRGAVKFTEANLGQVSLTLG